MNTERDSVAQDWLLWLVMNVLGYAGWICSCAIPLVVVADRDNDFAGFLFLGGQGVVTGLAQWLVIRWRIPRAGWWIFATAIGWPAGLLAGIALLAGSNIADDRAGILVLATLGASLGLAQWFVLRGKVRNAEWWILVSTATWAVSGFVGATVTTAVNTDPIIVTSAATLAGLLTTWALAESMRGVVLSWLLHRPVAVGTKPDEIPSQAQ